MSSKVVTATYVVELTESERGCLSITVTPQAQSEDCSARPAIETSLDTSETIQKLSREVSITSPHPLLYRC